MCLLCQAAVLPLGSKNPLVQERLEFLLLLLWLFQEWRKGWPLHRAAVLLTCTCYLTHHLRRTAKMSNNVIHAEDSRMSPRREMMQSPALLKE